MAAALHFATHSAVADFERARRIPAAPVLVAYERFFGLASGSLVALRRHALVERAGHEVRRHTIDQWAGVAPVGAPQEVRDGADPDAAGCHDDAITVYARKIGLVSSQAILGQVELRYSARRHAAWGRFLGYGPLHHLTRRHSLEIRVSVTRDPDGASQTYRDVYWFDYHWCDLLVTTSRDGSPRLFTAMASVYFDGDEVGVASTGPFSLR
jgi:hypothetical protein